MEDPSSGLLSLPQIHDAMAFKAMRGGFLNPLRVFFREMELEWGDCKSACAFRRRNKPVIQLGRHFFATEVRHEGEAADVVFHEIMHHLLRHLLLMKDLMKKGYSPGLQNVAMDAIINAHLARVGCAEFMERYYLDQEEFAFLRPNSRDFRITVGRWRRRVLPVRLVSTSKSQEFYAFYDKLYALEATLEDALKFFQKHFPNQSNEQELLGDHDQEADSDSESKPADGKGGGLFSDADARTILEALKVVPAEVSRQTSDNFAEIIRRVASILSQDGAVRAGTRISRRMPAKLNRRDILNVERERYLFRRADYRLQEVVLCPDISISMDRYIPFMVGLIGRLRKADLAVRTVCWAGRPVEVPFTDVLAGKLPDNASRRSTNGEELARFLEKERLAQAVIVTDNEAGRITTKINARVQLCLVEGATESGSFLDKDVVPRCTTHRLKLRGG